MLEDFVHKSSDLQQPIPVEEQEVRACVRTHVALGIWAVLLIGVFISVFGTDPTALWVDLQIPASDIFSLQLISLSREEYSNFLFEA